MYRSCGIGDQLSVVSHQKDVHMAKWRLDDLDVFKRAYELSLDVHRLSQSWPKSEQYGGVADQIRRASKSICALLAVGVGRQRSSDAEFSRYCIMALGSADEVQLWCRYARDLDFIDSSLADRWQNEYQAIARMLQGLISRLASED